MTSYLTQLKVRLSMNFRCKNTLLGFLILLIGCDMKKSSPSMFTELDISSYNNERLLCSDKSTDVKYIKLSSDAPSDLIGSVSNVNLHNDLLYVFDSRQKKIVAYNLNGKPQKVLHRVGRGPGEYLSASAWCVGSDDNLVMVDNRSKKAIFYDGGFNFIKEIKLDYNVEAIEELTPETYIIALAPYNRDQYKKIQLMCVNKEFAAERVIKEYTEVDVNYVLGAIKLQKSGDKVFYHRPIDDYIYYIDSNGEISGGYYVNYGGKSVPPEQRLNIDYYVTNETIAAYTTIVNCVVVNDNHIYGQVFDEMNFNPLHIDIRNGIYYTSSTADFSGKFVGGTDSLLIVAYDGYNLKDDSMQTSNLSENIGDDDIIIGLHKQK